MHKDQLLETINNEVFILSVERSSIESPVLSNHDDIEIINEIDRVLGQTLGTSNFHWSDIYMNVDVIPEVRNQSPSFLVAFQYDFPTLSALNVYKLSHPNQYSRYLQEHLAFWTREP